MSERAEPNAPTPPSPAPRPAGPSTDSCFAWMRTRLAADSMLMSWMGLATTLVGFGFTIEQFFERLEQLEKTRPALAPRAPHLLGMALILAGTLGLFAAIVHYVALVRRLHHGPFRPLAETGRLPINGPALAIATGLALIGAATFVTVLFRLA